MARVCYMYILRFSIRTHYICTTCTIHISLPKTGHGIVADGLVGLGSSVITVQALVISRVIFVFGTRIT